MSAGWREVALSDAPHSSSEKWMLQDWAKAPLNSQPYSTADAKVLTQVGVPPAKWCTTPLVPTGSMGTVPKRHEPRVPQTSEELGIASPGAQSGKEEKRRISAGDIKPKASNT